MQKPEETGGSLTSDSTPTMPLEITETATEQAARFTSLCQITEEQQRILDNGTQDEKLVMIEEFGQDLPYGLQLKIGATKDKILLEKMLYTAGKEIFYQVQEIIVDTGDEKLIELMIDRINVALPTRVQIKIIDFVKTNPEKLKYLVEKILKTKENYKGQKFVPEVENAVLSIGDDDLDSLMFKITYG
ncbi:MAG: hypothetical protein N4A38_02305 [Candidatus Gracilibacteria bacterium]|nr:hypothetical protein [Candidatus Gracilibacteria bacterium]